MTIYFENISSTIQEMSDLFDDVSKVSIRTIKPSEKDSNRFDVVVRCSDEVGELIKRKRSVKGINKALSTLN